MSSSPGKIYCILYCGDLYRFFVDHEFNLVSTEKSYLGCLNSEIAFPDVPLAVQKDLLEQIYHDHGASQAV